MTSRGGGTTPHATRVLLLLLTAAVAARLLVCLVLLPYWEISHGVGRFPDGYPYLAQSLLEERTLGFGPWGGASPTTAKGPGFPLWLALGIAAGGDQAGWLGFWSGVPTLVLAWFLGRAAMRRFGVVPAVVAIVAVTLHPVAVLITARVLPDEFYGALGMGACLALVAAWGEDATRRRIALAALSAVLLGAHMLTRSTGILTAFAMVLGGTALGAAAGERASTRVGFSPTDHPRPRWRAILTSCVVFVALIPPLIWSVRSSRLEERPVWVHSLAAYNFWVGEAFDRHAFGWIDQERWSTAVDLLVEQGAIAEEERAGFHYANLTPPAMAAMETRLQQAAARLIQEHPLRYFGRCARGVYRFWFQSQSRARTIQYAVSVAPLLVLAALGAFSLWRQAPPEPTGVLCLGVIALHNIAYAMILPMGRFSVEVYPHAAWLAAGGAVVLSGARFRRLQRIRT